MTSTSIRTVDYHTAGEPFRIIVGGAPDLEGASILDKRRFALEHLDHIRELLIYEPRGHADMYGCYVTDPEDERGDLGVVFFHNAGYSTACGHGTIALVTWALEEGVVPATSDPMQVIVDAPSGRLTTTARLHEGKVNSVRFRNVPSFVFDTGMKIPTARGEIAVDISYGGAFYASVSANDLGLAVEPKYLNDFIGLGREIKHRIEAEREVVHPEEPELRDVYGVIFWDEFAGDGDVCQRNVTIFADGEVDRSPCGSGTSARLALLDATGTLPRGARLQHRGIAGGDFSAWVVGDATAGDVHAVTTEVEGSAFVSGRHEFILDDRDPIGTGFLLR